MKFVIAVAAWGERCVSLFTGPVLNSHADALSRFAGEVRYVVHTDRPEVISAAVKTKTGRLVDVLPVVVQKNHYATARACQSEVIASLDRGDVLVLLNADILVSVECFEAISWRVAEGKKMVICCGTRTLPTRFPGRDIACNELLTWAMQNQHPITRECFYGTGTTDLPWAIYFKRGASTVLRGFHLHPLAVVNDRPLKFEKSIDWNLAACFSNDEIYVVTGKNELALAEISPAERRAKSLGRAFNAEDIIAWARQKTIPFHWWLFSHRIVIEGDDVDCGDDALLSELMAHKNRTVQPA